VVDFVVSIQEETYIPTRYPPENLAKIDHDIEEAENGINVERFSSMDEALKSLGLR
jgi:hypothetical protein